MSGSAVGTYVLLALVARAVGPPSYPAFALGWAVLLIAVAGFLAPLEQESARAIAEGRDVPRRSGRNAILLVLLGVAGAAPWLLGPLDLGLPGLLAALGSALVAVPVHVARGRLAGQGRFTRYVLVLVLEAGARAALVLVLLLQGVTSPAAHLAAVGAGTLVALLAADPRRAQGPAARGLVPLAGGLSVAQMVLNSPPILVALLAAPGAGRAALAPLLTAATLARVPLFAFTAVQAGLVPALAGRVATGDVSGALGLVRRLLVLVAGGTAAATAGALLLGEQALVLVFGASYALPGQDLALLVLASGAYLLASAAGAALAVLQRHGVVLLAWVAGAGSLVLVALLTEDAGRAVEFGLLAGCAVPALLLLHRLIRPSARP